LLHLLELADRITLAPAFNAFHIHLYLFRVGDNCKHQLLQVSISNFILQLSRITCRK
jgi:hypothetical protein